MFTRSLAVAVSLICALLFGEKCALSQALPSCFVEDDPKKIVFACTQKIEYKEKYIKSDTKGDSLSTLVAAYVYRGLAHERMDDFDRAATDFREVIRYADEGIRRSVDGIVSIYEYRARAYASLGNNDLALSDCREILRRDPSMKSANTIRAGILMEQNLWDDAIADYTTAIQISHSSQDYRGRAWSYFRKGMLNEARTDINMAIRLDPQQEFSRTVRGYVNSALGSHDAAIADFSKAVTLGSKTPLTYVGRGAVYAALGKKDLAIADLRRALSLAARRPIQQEAQAEARERLAVLEAAPTPSVGLAPPPPTATAAVVSPSPPSKPVEKASPASAPLRRIALVIGNSAYHNAPALANPASDARAMAQTFRRLGFNDIIELYDLNLTTFSSALKDFGDRAIDADWAVLYFAGHGLEVGGQNYLVPIDAALLRASHVGEEAVPLERVLAKVQPARKLKLVILDSCRNNPFAQHMAQEKGAMRSMGRGFARVEPLGGVLVAYAARDGSVAADGFSAHSPFTQALLDHLERPGLELSLMFRQVRDAVVQVTHGDQEPFTYGSLPGEAMYFRTAAQ